MYLIGMLVINFVFSLFAYALTSGQAIIFLFISGLIIISVLNDLLKKQKIGSNYETIILYVVLSMLLSLLIKTNYVFIFYNLTFSTVLIFVMYIWNADKKSAVPEEVHYRNDEIIIDVPVSPIRYSSKKDDIIKFENQLLLVDKNSLDKVERQLEGIKVKHEKTLALSASQEAYSKAIQNLFEEKEEISNQLNKMKEILNENFNVLEQERKEKSRIELELQKLREKIESSNTVLNNLNYRLNEKDLNTNETVWLKEQLEKEIEKNQKMHSELEIKNEENEIVLYEAITMEYQYEQTTENHEQIMKENKFLQNRVNDLQKELNENFAVLEKRRKEKRREIKDRWGLYFPKFDIETRVFRDALNYTAEELKEIEAILISLHSTENPRTLSRGKVNDGGIYYDHVGVNTINVPTRILYQVDKKKDKLVTIVRLYKHNEKYMS